MQGQYKTVRQHGVLQCAIGIVTIIKSPLMNTGGMFQNRMDTESKLGYQCDG